MTTRRGLGIFVGTLIAAGCAGGSDVFDDETGATSGDSTVDTGSGGPIVGSGGSGGSADTGVTDGSTNASSAATTAATSGGGGTSSASSTASAATSTAQSSSAAATSGSGAGNPGAIVDLRADVNRNGTIDFGDPNEDSETGWDASRGAIFLANIDDDALACAKSGTDAQLAACNDAADNVINGYEDLADLARLMTAPWPGAPANASGTITVSSAAKPYVRLFKKSGVSFVEYLPGEKLPAAELQKGVELAIEGKDIVRDAAVWDGFVDVTFTVDGGNVMGGTDVVRMRLAPLVFRHHLDPVATYYVTKFDSADSIAFRTDMAEAAKAAGVALHDIIANDQWTQDFFETAYMAMPALGGAGAKKVIHVNVRSANYTSGKLRTAGKIVFTDLRGKDAGGLVSYDPNHNDGMDTENSFGNFETIPPYTANGKTWPLGRVVRGSTAGFYPDKTFDKMVASQSVQGGIVYVNTEWLLVGHVDETLSFIKAPSPRGWAMLLNDPAAAKKMFETQKTAGYGTTKVFNGMYWSNNASATTTISGVLANTDVMNESAWAAVKIGDQKTVLKQETGLTDAEIVGVPFLHMTASGYSIAYQPGTVNGIYLGDKVFAPPKPHGPVINGADIFQTQLSQALAPFGVNVSWVEDWDLYHALDGEVHCGSNTTRVVPAKTNWWESGK
jgi:protein-arginine deiminase